MNTEITEETIDLNRRFLSHLKSKYNKRYIESIYESDDVDEIYEKLHNIFDTIKSYFKGPYLHFLYRKYQLKKIIKRSINDDELDIMSRIVIHNKVRFEIFKKIEQAIKNKEIDSTDEEYLSFRFDLEKAGKSYQEQIAKNENYDKKVVKYFKKALMGIEKVIFIKYENFLKEKIGINYDQMVEEELKNTREREREREKRWEEEDNQIYAEKSKGIIFFTTIMTFTFEVILKILLFITSTIDFIVALPIQHITYVLIDAINWIIDISFIESFYSYINRFKIGERTDRSKYQKNIDDLKKKMRSIKFNKTLDKIFALYLFKSIGIFLIKANTGLDVIEIIGENKELKKMKQQEFLEIILPSLCKINEDFTTNLENNKVFSKEIEDSTENREKFLLEKIVSRFVINTNIMIVYLFKDFIPKEQKEDLKKQCENMIFFKYPTYGEEYVANRRKEWNIKDKWNKLINSMKTKKKDKLSPSLKKRKVYYEIDKETCDIIEKVIEEETE